MGRRTWMVRDRVRNGNAEHTHRPAATTPPERSEEEHEERSDERGVRGAEADQAGALPRKAVLGWHDGSMKVEAR
jgi:hypothetical protein